MSSNLILLESNVPWPQLSSLAKEAASTDQGCSFPETKDSS